MGIKLGRNVEHDYIQHGLLMITLNAPIETKVICFSRLLKCLRSLYGKQCGPRSDCFYIGAVCSGSTLFTSILNSSVMLGNYLQQMTSADDIFRCIFFLPLLGLSVLSKQCKSRKWASKTIPDLQADQGYSLPVHAQKALFSHFAIY